MIAKDLKHEREKDKYHIFEVMAPLEANKLLFATATGGRRRRLEEPRKT